MSKMFMNVKEVMEVLEVSESYAYKLMKRLNRELQAMGCQKSLEKLTANIFTNSSTEPDQMMGGIRNGNLQEQQWHLVCNDPLSGLDRCKKAKM